MLVCVCVENACVLLLCNEILIKFAKYTIAIAALGALATLPAIRGELHSPVTPGEWLITHISRNRHNEPVGTSQ